MVARVTWHDQTLTKLRAMAELANWPRLEIRRGCTIGGGSVGWALFLDTASVADAAEAVQALEARK